MRFSKAHDDTTPPLTTVETYTYAQVTSEVLG